MKQGMKSAPVPGVKSNAFFALTAAFFRALSFVVDVLVGTPRLAPSSPVHL